MGIDVSMMGSTATISIKGRFDFKLQRDFRSAYEPLIANAEVADIEVNLSSVDYLDSSALGMLLMLRERATAHGKSVVLSHPTTGVTQVLEIANFAKLFSIVQ